MPSTRQTAGVLALVVALALVPVSTPATAAGGTGTPSATCPAGTPFDSADTTPRQNESGNVSILAYAVGPDVSLDEVPDASTDANTVPLGGHLVVRVTAPDIATRADNVSYFGDPEPTLTLQWPCFLYESTEGARLVHGDSDDVVYLVFGDGRELPIPAGEQRGKQAELRVSESFPGIGEDTHIEDEFDVESPTLFTDFRNGTHVRPGSVTLTGESDLAAGESGAVTLLRNGTVIHRSTFTADGAGGWSTTVDLSDVPNGTHLRYELSSDGALHDAGTLVVDESPVELTTVRVLEDIKTDMDLSVGVEIRNSGLTTVDRPVTVSVVDAETGDVVNSREYGTLVEGNRDVDRELALSAPDPGSYEVVVEYGTETVRRNLTVHGTETTTPPGTTTQPPTSTVPASDLTFAEDPGTSELPGFGVLATLTALALLALRRN
ncbi:hypothetical protein [Haloarchaeobius amylolyticus]|uniref:hypothetical protein n=1 Tax=Haloarchaeobius amylolyticus TaxID=1198296 RepID=UPI002270AA30|nr:hypothetical protein [Haloarchaeobius amylolyticus]